jgi:hypothetical protein
MQVYSDLLGQGHPLDDRGKEEKDIDSLFSGGKTTAWSTPSPGWTTSN